MKSVLCIKQRKKEREKITMKKGRPLNTTRETSHRERKVRERERDAWLNKFYLDYKREQQREIIQNFSPVRSRWRVDPRVKYEI